MTRLTRRRLLGTGVGAVASGLAGCLDGGGPSGDDGSLDVQASFFVTSDFARNVAGDAATVNTLVPFGQHGHGWEPGPDIQRTVVESDVFVYVGEGFQSWADRIVTNLREDDADVAIVEAWKDVDLHGAGHEHDEDDEHGHGNDSDDDHEEEHDDDHDHGPKDPHFWLDPRRSRRAVETIADGLRDADPENDSVYRENAEGYGERLSELDRTFETGLEDRTTDVILFAGHNSFEYLGHRYDFRIESLTGLAPDAEPSPRDRQRAQEIVEEHDVEYVLAPVFESNEAAEQLADDTDATEVLPLTPIPGVTEEWLENDWGYVEIMENVNLPTLETALGAR